MREHVAGERACENADSLSFVDISARLIYRLGFCNHITDALTSLHWLRVRERIEFKLATLTCKFLHNPAPSYLGPLVRVADVSGRRALRSANTDRPMVPHVRLSSAELSWLLHLVCGTICLAKLHLLSHCIHSGDISKHSCFSNLFRTSS